jgi:tetratricopeptide (TPR) repeat protein
VHADPPVEHVVGVLGVVDHRPAGPVDANRAKLKDLFARLGDENAAYAMKCGCAGGGTGRSETIVDHVRLFRNDPRLRWTYRVHEQILPALRAAGGEVRWSDVTIRHVGYVDPAVRRAKLDRDLRLLHLDDRAKPDDPFTLFNLGTVYLDLNKPAEALSLLRRSLQRSRPADSIVRKLYALIVGCHRRLGKPDEALAACREGLGQYPRDAELLFLEGLLQRERGDAAAAESSWRRVLDGNDGAHFGSIDGGLAGPKVRHNLAVLFVDQKRYADAEARWREALAADPSYSPARPGLAEAYLALGRWADLDDAVRRLDEEMPEAAAVLRGRAHIDRQEFAAARDVLVGAIARRRTSACG